MSSSQNTSRNARSARLVALALAIPFLLLIAAFIALPFFRHDEVPLNAIGPIGVRDGAAHGGTVFRGTANIWEVRGQLFEDRGRRIYVTLALIGPGGQPPDPPGPPLVVTLHPLAADGSEGAALQPPLASSGAGQYSLSTTLPASGRWRLRLEFPEVRAVFGFTTSE